MVANGAKVHVCDIRPEALETVVRLYDKGPGQIIACASLTTWPSLPPFPSASADTRCSCLPPRPHPLSRASRRVHAHSPSWPRKNRTGSLRRPKHPAGTSTHIISDSHTVDVGDKASVQRLAAAVAALEPRGIQLLVNNAGVALDPHTEFAGNGMPDVGDAAALSAHFLRSDPGDWARMFAVNVAGAFFMSVAFLPLLERGGRGARRSSSVVNVASNSGFLKGSTRGYIGYSASKAGKSSLAPFPPCPSF